MDDFEFRKFRAVIFGGLLFLISCWKMIGETKYLIWGQRSEATIDSAELKERTGRRGRRDTVMKVSFHYTDSSTGQPAQGNLTVEPGPTWMPGRPVSVQYLPGVADSARQGADVVMVTIFVVALGVISFSLYGMYREANDPIPSSRNSGQRRRYPG